MNSPKKGKEGDSQETPFRGTWCQETAAQVPVNHPWFVSYPLNLPKFRRALESTVGTVRLHPTNRDLVDPEQTVDQEFEGDI